MPIVVVLVAVATGISLLDHDRPSTSVDRGSGLAPPAQAIAGEVLLADRPQEAVAGVDAQRAPVVFVPERDARVLEASAANLVRGRVIDDVGSVVTSFTVEVCRPGKEPTGQRAFTTAEDDPWTFSDAHGEFDLGRLNAGEWLITAVRASGTRSLSHSIVVPYTGRPVELVLPRDASVRGIVLDAAEQPVEGAEVHFDVPGGIDLRMRGVDSRRPDSISDASGSFLVAAAPAGDVRVVAHRDGHCDSEWIEANLEPGGAAFVTLRMQKGGRVVGSIDPSSGPVADRHIGLVPSRGRAGWSRTRSDAAGRFALENVMPQAYVLELMPAEDLTGGSDPSAFGIRKNITVVVGETTEVVFGAAATPIEIRGIVLTGNRPAMGFGVRAYSTEGGENRGERAVSGAGGEFTLAVPVEGAYSFTVSRGHWAKWVERRVDGPGPIDIVLEMPGGGITGVVMSPKGEKLNRVPITILREPDPGADPRHETWERYARTKSDEEGRFEFGLLAPGRYTLRAPDGFQGDSPPDRTFFGHVVVSDLEVSDSTLNPIEVRLTPEGFVAGRVLDETGRAVAQARVLVLDDSGRGNTAFFAVSTDARGSFEFSSIAPGTYTLRAQKESRSVTSSEFTVHAGKRAKVEVVLP